MNIPLMRGDAASKDSAENTEQELVKLEAILGGRVVLKLFMCWYGSANLSDMKGSDLELLARPFLVASNLGINIDIDDLINFLSEELGWENRITEKVENYCKVIMSLDRQMLSSSYMSDFYPEIMMYAFNELEPIKW